MIIISTQKIPTGRGPVYRDHVTVTVLTDVKRIRVTWPCGTARSFRRERIDMLIEEVELTAGAFPDVCMCSEDAQNQSFAVRMADGQIHADTNASYGVQTPGVSWKALKKALRRAARCLDKLAASEEKQDAKEALAH